MTSLSFTDVLWQLIDTSKFNTFDLFLIHRFLPDAEEITEEIRHTAFTKFRKSTNYYSFASLPTMKNWFGINGYTTPRRHKVYEIAYALHLDMEETRLAFIEGLHAPDIQYTDYHEIFYVYGLEHRFPFFDVQDMIGDFEKNYSERTSFSKTHNTQQIIEQFSFHKKLPADKFMEWMLSSAGMFKGYSQTTLDCFNSYRTQILISVQQDVRQQLETLLKETDYASWVHKRQIFPGKNPYVLIQKYVNSQKKRKYPTISDNLLKNIQELNKIAWSDAGSNGLLLSELFASYKNNKYLPTMTNKHLSDLLNLPIQKEREIRAERALAELTGLSSEAPCPKWIADFIADYTKNKVSPQTAGDALQWIEHFLSEQHRRCNLIDRKDLLPLIHYVAQERYLKEIHKSCNTYSCDDAKALFTDMANATLTTCGMQTLDIRYFPDSILLACFTKEEMYSYTDVLDILETKERI